MREIVHLQVGQCGNQIGAKVSKSLNKVFSEIGVSLEFHGRGEDVVVGIVFSPRHNNHRMPRDKTKNRQRNPKEYPGKPQRIPRNPEETQRIPRKPPKNTQRIPRETQRIAKRIKMRNLKKNPKIFQKSQKFSKNPKNSLKIPKILQKFSENPENSPKIPKIL